MRLRRHISISEQLSQTAFHFFYYQQIILFLQVWRNHSEVHHSWLSFTWAIFFIFFFSNNIYFQTKKQQKKGDDQISQFKRAIYLFTSFNSSYEFSGLWDQGINRPGPILGLLMNYNRNRTLTYDAVNKCKHSRCELSG